MGFSSFIDIGIGLVVMYLVLSLICTIVNEFIVTILAVRAKTLAKTMRALIDDPNIRTAFYNHGLITNAAQASRSGAGASTSTYIPTDDKHPSYFDPRTVALALLDSLDPQTQSKPKTQKEFPGMDEIKASIAALPDSNIRDVLLTSLANANNDIDKVREEVSAWFDTAMDRLSGGYKRYAKNLSIIIGIAIAVVLNADSLNVSRALWSDAALRAQMVSTGAALTENANLLAPLCPQTVPAEKVTCLIAEARKHGEALRPLPIGWSAASLPKTNENEFLWGIFKLFGLIWTGLALSLGAPFWFDLLQKFMSVRGAQKPDKKDKK